MYRTKRQVKSDKSTGMDKLSPSPLAQQLAAAQEWWRDAGVDCAFEDEVQVWLAEPEDLSAPKAPIAFKPPVEAAPKPEPPVPQVRRAELPSDLSQFAHFWTNENFPLFSGSAPRIAPRGGRGPALMVLVPMPERTDSDRLLSGPQGRLVSNVLRALGIAEDDAYFASALPGNMLLPDWQALALTGLDDVVQHHVALCEPKRLLILGSDVARMFEGAKPSIPVFAGYSPERLLEHPRQRARLWQRLLEWTAPR